MNFHQFSRQLMFATNRSTVEPTVSVTEIYYFYSTSDDDALWSRESTGARWRRQMALRTRDASVVALLTAHHCSHPTNPRRRPASTQRHDVWTLACLLADTSNFLAIITRTFIVLILTHDGRDTPLINAIYRLLRVGYLTRDDFSAQKTSQIYTFQALS